VALCWGVCFLMYAQHVFKVSNARHVRYHTNIIRHHDHDTLYWMYYTLHLHACARSEAPPESQFFIGEEASKHTTHLFFRAAFYFFWAAFCFLGAAF
jgi:hypothetical protein